jgi:hypothetical protein
LQAAAESEEKSFREEKKKKPGERASQRPFFSMGVPTPLLAALGGEEEVFFDIFLFRVLDATLGSRCGLSLSSPCREMREEQKRPGRSGLTLRFERRR